MKSAEMRSTRLPTKQRWHWILLMVIVLMAAVSYGTGKENGAAGYGAPSIRENSGRPVGWSGQEIAAADLGRPAEYLSEDERDVVLFLNLARLYPGKFARTYLVPLRSRFSGKLLARPHGDPIATEEGVAAVNECIRAMERQKPCKALLPARGLSRSATDHVEDCGPAGVVGHTGADGSTMGQRLDRHGEWKDCAGENIAFGDGDPLFIVVQLLVDDGVESRGHRENIFNDAFGRIGVAIGPHETWRSMCVMDFAGDYSDGGKEL